MHKAVYNTFFVMAFHIFEFKQIISIQNKSNLKKHTGVLQCSKWPFLPQLKWRVMHSSTNAIKHWATFSLRVVRRVGVSDHSLPLAKRFDCQTLQSIARCKRPPAQALTPLHNTA